MAGGLHGYHRVKEIGAGSFGKCYLVKSKEGKQYVMKQVDTSRMNSKERKDAMSEVKVLSALKHPYIVCYRESFVEDNKLCIVMDYAEGGDLFKMIDRVRRACSSLGEPKILRWMTQALLALKYLHDKHVLHRDLKSQNIFLTHSGRVKLGDFGISKVLENTQCFAKTSIGTPYYLAPEICQQRPYSWTADIWALGCVLYEMCMLRMPFDAQSFRALTDRITRGPIPKLGSQYSKDLIRMNSDMLERDAKKRPSAAELLHRPLIQGEIRKMLEEERGKDKPKDEKREEKREERREDKAPLAEHRGNARPPTPKLNPPARGHGNENRHDRRQCGSHARAPSPHGHHGHRAPSPHGRPPSAHRNPSPHGVRY